MAGERKGEMLQDVKEECHRAKEELQDQLTASEGENNAARRRLLAYRECLVQQSEQLPCQHTMQEEVPVGEEGYCSERAKVQVEAQLTQSGE